MEDRKSPARRCYTIPSPFLAGQDVSCPGPLRSRACCIINIASRVGVNGPMLKLTFISFIHPAKSVALTEAGWAVKNLHLKTPCDSPSAMRPSWPFSSHEERGFRFMLETSARNLLILSAQRKSIRSRHLIIPHHQSPARERIENTFHPKYNVQKMYSNTENG